MAKFAILEGTKVQNIIIADSKEIAEQLTELTAIEVTDETGLPNIGYNYIDGFFRPEKPEGDFVWYTPWNEWVDLVTYEKLNS